MSWLPENFPGEKLVMKVADELKNGLGVVTRPWVTKRDAAAKAEAARNAMLLEAQTQHDVERLKRGEAVYEGGKLLSTTAPGAFSTPALSDATSRRVEPHFGSTPRTPEEFVRVADAQAEVLKLERSLALHRIARFAEEEAEQHEDDSAVSDDSVDPDWFTRWRTSAQDVRSEDMQRLWARILAGEAKSPGTFSLRTLNYLSTLSKMDAEAIARVASFVFDGRVYFEEGRGNCKKPSLKDIAYLADIGILTGVDVQGYITKYGSGRSDYFELALMCHDKVMFFRHPDRNKLLELPNYRLTKIGAEIVALGKFTADNDLIRGIGMCARSQEFKVFVCDAERRGGRNINPESCVELVE